MDDEARFRDLFEATYAAVRRYAHHRGGTGGAADDIVAQTFLVAWRRLDDVPRDDPVPWLLAVARNIWRNERRGDRRRLALLRRVARPEPVPPPEAAHDDTNGGGDRDSDSSDAVRDTLVSLDPADQEILRLVAWDGLAPAQAAVVLGITPGAARVRLHRARRRFADRLAERSPPEEPSGAETSIELGVRR